MEAASPRIFALAASDVSGSGVAVSSGKHERASQEAAGDAPSAAASFVAVTLPVAESCRGKSPVASPERHVIGALADRGPLLSECLSSAPDTCCLVLAQATSASVTTHAEYVHCRAQLHRAWTCHCAGSAGHVSRAALASSTSRSAGTRERLSPPPSAARRLCFCDDSPRSPTVRAEAVALPNSLAASPSRSASRGTLVFGVDEFAAAAEAAATLGSEGAAGSVGGRGELARAAEDAAGDALCVTSSPVAMASPAAASCRDNYFSSPTNAKPISPTAASLSPATTLIQSPATTVVVSTPSRSISSALPMGGP